jgi:hypothetical protein
MKYDENIEQLLNGFIDGQLTPREQTELKRLIRNEPQLERRLAELQKCRTLLGSLPVEKAPEGLIEQVKVSAGLAPRRSEVEYEPAGVIRTGAVELMFRKMLSAAAIILLAAGLLVIVWIVVSPGKKIPKQDFVAKVPQEIPLETPAKTIEEPVAKTGPADTTVAEAVSASGGIKIPEVTAKPAVAEKTVPAAPVFSATLELKANKPLAADVALKKVLEETVGSEFTLVSDVNDRYVYAIDCDVTKLNSFLLAAEGIWEQFSGTRLLVETGQAEQPVVIDSVKSWQIGDLAALSEPVRRIKAAQYYAILNNSQRLLQQDDKTLAQGEDDILQLLDKPKPKPLLTKDEQPDEKHSTGQQKVHLTIEVSADQQSR